MRKPVPVTTNVPVLASKVADVIVGVATLLTVMPLPVASAISVLPITVFQSSAAAKLYVVAPVELVSYDYFWCMTSEEKAV
ncbi:hypothetical protein [uncultured Nitrosomonas sp.]|uniref:hypothetical protein n=1 Tax=uncultured Nitrosomonas sp. TaxID=156424 RepID=UPI0025CBC138|nr:hypothetical protein [uncultured Nitrosomonas sp.]